MQQRLRGDGLVNGFGKGRRVFRLGGDHGKKFHGGGKIGKQKIAWL